MHKGTFSCFNSTVLFVAETVDTEAYWPTKDCAQINMRKKINFTQILGFRGVSN